MNEKCEHDILDEDYLYQYQCETPYCTVTEEKCLQCGCFIVSCGCGYNNDVREI